MKVFFFLLRLTLLYACVDVALWSRTSSEIEVRHACTRSVDIHKVAQASSVEPETTREPSGTLEVHLIKSS